MLTVKIVKQNHFSMLYTSENSKKKTDSRLVFNVLNVAPQAKILVFTINAMPKIKTWQAKILTTI